MSTMTLKKAAIINMIGKYSNVLIQLIINAILARLLSPEDFGVVALITVFTNFFLVLSDMGISTGIIQRKDLTNMDNNSIFSFTVILGIILAVLFAILGFFISNFYNNDIMITLCILLTVSVFFNTINMVPNAILLKNMDFVSIAIRTLLVNIIVGIITIILAIIGFKYYSLIINSILVSILTFILTIRKAPVKFCKIDKSSLKKISSISSFQFYFSFVNYFSRNLDNLTIGKFLGSSPLAYYDKAYKLMMYPNTMLTGVISTALHPILSNYVEQPKIIYKKYLDVLKFTLLLGVPIATICFFSADEIISIVYGNRWLQASNILKILSFSLLVQLCLSSTGAIFQSLGKTKDMFYIGLTNTFILCSFILVFLILKKSLLFVALGVMIGYNLNFFITYLILFIILFFLKDINIDNVFLSLIIKSLFICIAYLFILLLFKEKIIVDILKRIKIRR